MATNQPFSHLNGLPVIESVLTAAPPVVLARPTSSASDQADKWRGGDERIAGWAPASGEPEARTDEDGYLPPSGRAVAAAQEIAARLREGGVSVPVWLVQDGNGGIDFEWRSGDRAETLSVNALGETEIIEFENSKLIGRKPISFSPAHS
ncbi:MAG TPA: hypothetical protein PK867_06155 [Pirellulales bacterium]|nr:hypothetical protein [Pirellulales bacterium]